MGECLPAQLFGGVREQLRQRGGARCHGISSLAPPELSRRRDPGANEVDGISDGLDAGRLLLAHPDAVAVLELHHELVEVERVRVEVLAEAGLGLDLLRATSSSVLRWFRTSVITSSRSIGRIIPYRSTVS